MQNTFLDKLLNFILCLFSLKLSIFRSEKEADFVQATLAKNCFEKISLKVFKNHLVSGSGNGTKTCLHVISSNDFALWTKLLK